LRANLERKLEKARANCNFLKIYASKSYGDNIMEFLSHLFGTPVPALNASELNEKLKDSKRPLVLDVREPDEYRRGHISGAKLIPLGELHRRMKELPKDKEIVCVCASGSRSHSATKILVDAGYTAINMNGGMYNWQRAGLTVKQGGAS
jgi:rhodanese-related sulfurtransferase